MLASVAKSSELMPYLSASMGTKCGWLISMICHSDSSPWIFTDELANGGNARCCCPSNSERPMAVLADELPKVVGQVLE